MSDRYDEEARAETQALVNTIGNAANIVYARGLAAGRAEAAAEVARLTRERDEALAALGEQSAWSITRERDAALERCGYFLERLGYYERGNVPRLLGITPEQLDCVRAVLRAVDSREDDEDISEAVDDAWIAWKRAGRPLAEEESDDAG